jgi:hypothetical protein
MLRKPFEVRAGVIVRMVDRVAHAGLCGEMNHARELVPREQIEQPRAFSQVGFFEREPLVVPQHRQPRLLQRRVVVAVDAVEPDHRAALLQQLFGDVEADEPGSSGDENGVRRHCGASP